MKCQNPTHFSYKWGDKLTKSPISFTTVLMDVRRHSPNFITPLFISLLEFYYRNIAGLSRFCVAVEHSLKPSKTLSWGFFGHYIIKYWPEWFRNISHVGLIETKQPQINPKEPDYQLLLKCVQ